MGDLARVQNCIFAMHWACSTRTWHDSCRAFSRYKAYVLQEKALLEWWGSMDPVHERGSMDPVHGPGPRRGSMDQGSMFCTFPSSPASYRPPIPLTFCLPIYPTSKMAVLHFKFVPPLTTSSLWIVYNTSIAGNTLHCCWTVSKTFFVFQPKFDDYTTLPTFCQVFNW